MFIRNFFTSVIIAFFLAFVGVLLFSKAQAQVICTSDNECTGNLVCIDGVCNVPPPIWDSRSLSVLPQNASFDVQNDSRIRSNLTINGDIYLNNGKSLRVDGSGATVLNIGNWGTSATGLDVNVLGGLTVGAISFPRDLTVFGNIKGNFLPSNGISCAAGEILKRSSTAWVCSEDATGGGGGAGGEPLFTAWWNNGNPSLATLKLTTGAASGMVFTSDALGLGSWQPLPSGNLPIGSANQTLRHNGSGWVADNLLLSNGTAAVGVGAISSSYNFNVVGDINATARLCIRDDCRSFWPEASSGGGNISGSGFANRIAFWTGTSTLSNDANLQWDADAKRLSIAKSDGNAELNLKSLRAKQWAIYADQGIGAGADQGRDLRFWNDENRFWFSADGDFVAGRSVNANGCFGPVIIGATGGTYDGNLTSSGGYREIDSICNATSAGSHQCTTEEVMNSIHCGAIWTSPDKTSLKPVIIPTDEYVWIGNGAPSLPTPTNDCYGWTQNGIIGGEQSQGIAWYFDVQGGAAYARSCNAANRILCCK